MPSLLVLAASQPFGLAALGIAVAARGTGIPGDEVAWSALAAVAGTVGLFAFYRGMAAGAISIVAPIAALSAGIPVIWGVAVSGDHISGLQGSASWRRSAEASPPRSSFGWGAPRSRRESVG